MNDLFLGLMILSGMLAFGFFFGGIMTFLDQEEADDTKGTVLRVLDGLFLLSILSAIHDVAKNWNKNKEGRICIYSAIAFLGVTIGFATLRSWT